MRLLAAPVVVAALAACGGSGGSDLQSQADDIRQCLNSASVPADPTDSVPAFVDDPAVGVTMKFTSALGDPTSGDIWVFSTHEIAERARPKITLKTEDDQANEVVGADVVDFHGTIPSEESKAAVESCL